MGSKKRATQVARDAALKRVERTITMTLTADEHTLERLVNIMLYSTPQLRADLEELGPLPFDMPEEPSIEVPEDLYPMVRERCGKLLERFATVHGMEFAKNTLAEYGVERLSLLPDADLGDFLADMEKSLGLEKGERMI